MAFTMANHLQLPYASSLRVVGNEIENCISAPDSLRRVKAMLRGNPLCESGGWAINTRKSEIPKRHALANAFG